MSTEINDPAVFTERFINQTNQSIFLTGKAGTGKTTLLKKIIASTYKNAVIVAPTGIAALNAGGVTIHSFFQLPFGGFVPEFGSTLSARVQTEASNESPMSLASSWPLRSCSGCQEGGGCESAGIILGGHQKK